VWSFGNNIVESNYGEQCDGTDLAGYDCTTITGGFNGGTLTCSDNCMFDTSACTQGSGGGSGGS